MRKIIIASRKSDLARIQSYQVAKAIRQIDASIDIEFKFRESLGDKNLQDPLWKSPSKGLFTEDFYTDLIEGKCDVVVHSWKDLPTELRSGTEVAATLKRADPRDLLLIKRDAWKKVTTDLHIYSSSPRREYNLVNFLKWALPINNLNTKFIPVRGNIRTRIDKLFSDQSVDGLIVAKAAIDRLIEAGSESYPENFSEQAEYLKNKISKCLLTIIPLSENPCAAAQGALALEIHSKNQKLKSFLSKMNHFEDYKNIEAERKTLKSYGGGCHQKIGVYCGLLPRSHTSHASNKIPTVTSDATTSTKLFFLKGLTDQNLVLDESRIEDNNNSNIKTYTKEESFPGPNEEALFFNRRELNVAPPQSPTALWISRSNALPTTWNLSENDVVWTAGLQTWRKLAKRGVWINGSSESLGESFGMEVENLFPNLKFFKLSHQASNDFISLAHSKRPQMPLLATYELQNKDSNDIKDSIVDLSKRKNFYWMSASAFSRALEIFPNLADTGQHASGAGQTADFLRSKLGPKATFHVFLGLSHWRNKTIKTA